LASGNAANALKSSRPSARKIRTMYMRLLAMYRVKHGQWEAAVKDYWISN